MTVRSQCDLDLRSICLADEHDTPSQPEKQSCEAINQHLSIYMDEIDSSTYCQKKYPSSLTADKLVGQLMDMVSVPYG